MKALILALAVVTATITAHVDRVCDAKILSYDSDTTTIQLACNAPFNLFLNGAFYRRYDEPFLGIETVPGHVNTISLEE